MWWNYALSLSPPRSNVQRRVTDVSPIILVSDFVMTISVGLPVLLSLDSVTNCRAWCFFCSTCALPDMPKYSLYGNSSERRDNPGSLSNGSSLACERVSLLSSGVLSWGSWSENNGPLRDRHELRDPPPILCEPGLSAVESTSSTSLGSAKKANRSG